MKRSKGSIKSASQKYVDREFKRLWRSFKIIKRQNANLLRRISKQYFAQLNYLKHKAKRVRFRDIYHRKFLNLASKMLTFKKHLSRMTGTKRNIPVWGINKRSNTRLVRLTQYEYLRLMQFVNSGRWTSIHVPKAVKKLK